MGGVFVCCNMFCMILESIWVSDERCFSLINIKSKVLYFFMNSYGCCYGYYIVNSEDVLIFIDINNNIKNFLKDMIKLLCVKK